MQLKLAASFKKCPGV